MATQQSQFHTEGNLVSVSIDRFLVSIYARPRNNDVSYTRVRYKSNTVANCALNVTKSAM